jgi:DNA polymerase elongation subunit (family B)
MNKVLVYDIETAPMVAYVWELKDQFIAINQIVSDTYMLAWSAKWLGEPASSIVYYDQRNAKDMSNDKPILEPLWKLLDQADIAITQNGQSFDSRVINARFIMNGMKPPSPYKHLDTYRIAKRIARFTSNKLEYLTDKLCTKYKKKLHHSFPGMSLWKGCLDRDMRAWNEMKRYNIYDVLSTEELYGKLKAWTPESMPNVHGVNFPATDCRVCGSGTKMWKKGSEIKKTGRYHRYQCQGCFAWTTGGKVK